MPLYVGHTASPEPSHSNPCLPHLTAAHKLNTLDSHTMAKPRVFGVLLFDQFTSLDAMGPLAYFNNLPDVEIHIIHDTMSPVTTGGDWPSPAHVAGQRYLPNYTMDNAPPLDVLLVPGGLGVPHHLADRRWEEFIARVYPKLQFLLTVCNGTPFVTRTGLLDHRRATSNKAAFQWVQAQGPNVDWVVEARWVVDGNIWTSSGAPDVSIALNLIR